MTASDVVFWEAIADFANEMQDPAARERWAALKAAAKAEHEDPVRVAEAETAFRRLEAAS